MDIDIISFTNEQYASLSDEQIIEIKSAQLKKNTLDRKLIEEKLKEKHRLIENGMFLSNIWTRYCEKLQQAHDQEVETLRESLLFYLQFAARPNVDLDAPYLVDYALEMSQRYYIVRDYYVETYPAMERAPLLLKDEVARQYLGELYRTLYDYLLQLAQKEGS